MFWGEMMKTKLLTMTMLLFVVLYGCSQQNYTTPAAQQVPAANPAPAAPSQTPAPSPAPKTPTLEPQKSTAQSYAVNIQGFAFSPGTITIKAGDTVVWTNMDSAGHSVTSDSGNELSSPIFSNGKTYSHTFNTAGTYSYHCNVHPSMQGTIVVQ